MGTINAIAAVRVSSTKQGLAGDSPEDQLIQIENKAKALNIRIVKCFKFIKSASGDIQPCQEAVDFCKEHEGKIKLFLVKSIDRFTRGGGYYYESLVKQLAKYGVQLIDVQGVISPTKINTLDHLNIAYSWSQFSPTKTAELIQAESSKGEVRDILTRLIGAEIRYTRMGYAVRDAPMGYMNEKVDTIHGKRIIRKAHPIESRWFIKMFELRTQGNLSDFEIVNHVNLLGFKTRVRKIHDKNDPTRIIGTHGGSALTLKQFYRYIQNPIYAGVNNEKWMDGKPIKTKFDGLVSIDLFNRANRGKITIVEDGDTVMIYKGKPPLWQQQKNKNNPMYPYKFIRCPQCRNPLLGSASLSKSGKHIPRYHCARSHKYWSINRIKFDETIHELGSHIRFHDEFKKRFGDIVLEEWNNRQRSVSEQNISLNRQVADIESQINLIKDKIKAVSSPEVIKRLEGDVDDLMAEKIRIIQIRDHKEDEQVKIETLINYVEYYMEHLHELILGGDDTVKNAKMFELLFDDNPTFEELKNGTPKLAPIFALDEAFVSSQNQFVRAPYQIWHLPVILLLDIFYQIRQRWGI